MRSSWVAVLPAWWPLLNQGRRVRLIDRAPALGGLMRSVQSPHGQSFDIGTHYLLSTGLPELDALITADVDEEHWYRFTTSLPEGNIFGGVLNTESGCLDARRLEVSLLERIRREIFDRAGRDMQAEYGTLAEQADAMYGPTAAETLIAPLMRRFTGLPLEELAPDAHHAFGLSRIILLDDAEARAAKKTPQLDQVVAYVRGADNTSSIIKYYPKQGGIGRWVENMERRLRNAGCEISLNTHVTKVAIEGDRVTGITLNDGTVVASRELIWTVPSALLLAAAGQASAGTPPKFVSLELAHMVVDRPVMPDVHYIYHHDAGLRGFRTTLYPNIADDRRQGELPHRITVEFVGCSELSDEELLETAAAEIRETGIVPPETTVLHGMVDRVRNAFPAPTPALNERSKADHARASRLARNITLLGRGAGAHFQREILVEVYQTLAGR